MTPGAAAAVDIAPSAATASSLAYGQVRRDIIQGALLPDARLRIQEMALRYGCGAIPLREALNRLTAERLVVHSQQRGFAVAPISGEDLADLTQARSWTAQAALREAVAHGDAAWEERVLLAHHRLSKVPRYLRLKPPEPNPAYDEPHRAFHAALLSGCGSQWMVELCGGLFDHAERYRNLSRKIAVVPREKEHAALVDAALGRRVDEAVALIKGHVELTARIVLEGDAAVRGARQRR